MEVTEEVKAIRDLRRFRCALCRTPGIVLGTVAGNDCHSRVGAQPCRDRLRRALRQEIDGPMLFKIDQDRARDPPLAEGKIINA
jgi:hypothetical protein